MRRNRSPRTREIAWILAALLVLGLAAVRWQGGRSAADSPIRQVDLAGRVDSPAPARHTAAAATPPVSDLASVTRHPAPEPSPDDDRFRTNDKFTADDLAHPERYFEAAEHLPELRRDEERGDALEFFLAYRARLERDLAVAGNDADKRAAVVAVIERYDAAIARLRSSPPTSAP